MPRRRGLLELVVLGSGSFAPAIGEAPADVRNPAGYALRVDDDLLLFDFGFGNLRQLFRANLNPASVTHAFFSHRHPDHVGDLPALLFYLRHAHKPSSGKLGLYGPRGFKAFVGRLMKAHHPWLSPRGYGIEIRELEDRESVGKKRWKVSCREVPHSTEALAFRLDSSSGSFCYTGDTGFDPGLCLFAKDADLFVLECSLPDHKKFPHHLQVSQAMTLFKHSGAKRGLLSHFSQASYADLRKKLGRNSGMKPAQDLMRIKI